MRERLCCDFLFLVRLPPAHGALAYVVSSSSIVVVIILISPQTHVPMRIFHQSSGISGDVMLRLCNASFEQEVFKILKLILLKKDYKSVLRIYQPIRLLPVFSKML